MPVIRNINEEATAPVTAGGATGCAMAVMVVKDDGAPNFAVRHITV